MSSLHKQLILFILALVPLGVFAGPNDYPGWEDSEVFKQDLQRGALVANLPTIFDADHFLGVQAGAAFLPQVIPSGRFSIFPNPEYNLWVQFARWPGDGANFAVGTGFQTAFRGEDPDLKKGVGLSWNTIFNEGYQQRDITIHGILGTTWQGFQLGAVLLLDMHHVLVDNNRGISDYDTNLLMAVPFLQRELGPTMRVTLQLPVSSAGASLQLSAEMLVGKRK